MEIKNELYRCTKCLIFQPKDNFHKKKNKLGIRSVCKDCRGIKRAETYAENKDKELEYCRLYKQNNPEKRKESANKFAAKNYIWFRGFLNEIKNVPCFDCEKLFPPCAMDFDHRDPLTKVSNISEMQSSSEHSILLEMAKCDVVCANCHRAREYNRRNSNNISYITGLLIELKNKPCADCGIQYSWYMMDFNHIDPTQKNFDLSKPVKINGKSFKESIIYESTKCEIVCANCHRIKTFVKRVAA